MPCYLSSIGDSTKTKSQQPSSSSKLSTSSKDIFYIRAMKESDPNFLEEAYHSALALYDPDAVVVAPTKKRKAQPKAKGTRSTEEGEAIPPAALAHDAETVAYPENEKCIYKLEKYRKTNSVGIRRKFADCKQVFSLSSKDYSFEHLESLGEKVIEMLQSKTEQPDYVLADVEQEVLIWGKAQIA